MSSTVPSSCVRASVRPSGLTASSTGYWSPSSVANGRPASNGRTSPPVAGQVPHDRAAIGPCAVERAAVGGDGQVGTLPSLWPEKISRSSPRSTSQAITLPSAPELTSVRPSGVKLTTSTAASWRPLKRRTRPERRSSRRRPPAGGAQREQASVGADRAGDVADGVALQHTQALRVDRVRRVVLRDGDEQAPAIGGRGQPSRRLPADTQRTAPRRPRS